MLSNPALRRVELAFLTFKAAESGTWVAILVYAYGLGGPTAAGLAALAQLLPAAVLAPLAGALADRRGAGRVLALGYVLQATTMAATAVALLAGGPPALVLGGAIAAAGSLVFTRPAQAALVAGLARSTEQLTAANVVIGWIESLGMLAAPAAAGLLLAVGGPGSVYAAMSVLLVAGSMAVRPLRGVLPPGRDERKRAEAPTALQLVAREGDARLLVLLVASTFAGIGALDVLYVVLAIDVLDLGGSGAGYLNAAFGAGGVLALGATAGLMGRRIAPALGAGAAAWTLALLALSIASGFASALLLLALAGIGRSLLDVGGRVLLQRVASPALLSRLFGALEAASMAGLAAGSLLVPVLIATGGTVTAIAGVAALPAVVGLAGLRRLLTIDERATVPVVEITLMRSSALFSLLPTRALERLARSLEPVRLAAGEALIRQGEQDRQRLYLVADGRLHVSRDGASLSTLERGATVGEIAVLRNVPRTASVNVQVDSQVYALDGQAFATALASHSDARSAVEQTINVRLAPAATHPRA